MTDIIEIGHKADNTVRGESVNTGASRRSYNKKGTKKKKKSKFKVRNNKYTEGK